MSHTKRESELTSHYTKILNKVRFENYSTLVSLKVHKKVEGNFSKFYDLLKKKYPEIYKEIRDECIKIHGKAKTKKEFALEEIEKLKDTPNSRFLKNRLFKKLKITNTKGS